MKISLIAAMTANRVIGRDNALPWRLPDDMRHFMQTTRGHVVLMGRRNFESLPPRFRPLPERVNLVLSRQANYRAADCIVFDNMQAALEFAKAQGEQELFVIGGAQVYKQALECADRVYLTEIHIELEGDAYFPEMGDEWKESSRQVHAADDKHPFAFDFVVYERCS